MFRSAYARLLAHAERQPSRTALTFDSTRVSTEQIQLTYADLTAAAERMAWTLARQLEPGERALILLPTMPEFATSFLGCLGAGCIAVPVPPPLDEGAARRLVNIADDCEASTVISTRFIRDLVDGTQWLVGWCESRDWLLVDELDMTPGTGSGRLPSIDEADIAFLQYTSGSTGTPRGVKISHGSLVANEFAIQGSFGVVADSTIVSWLPLHHDMGLIGGMLQPLHTGCRGVILDPVTFVQRPATWLETISRERADISGGPNFAYDLCVRKLSDEELTGLDLSCWRVAFNGAAQVFPRTLRRFSERFADAGFRHIALTPCYGLAEATLLVTAAEYGAPTVTRAFGLGSLETGRPRPADDHAGSRELVCYPLPSHARVRVIDPRTAQPSADGEVGEIVVAGLSNGSGYWNTTSSAAFGLALPGEDGNTFVRTGDLGFISGSELCITGRLKDLIVQRGRNVYAEDLENDMPDSDRDLRPGRGVAFGVERGGDEAIVVCHEVRTGTPPTQYTEIATAMRQTLSRLHAVAADILLLAPGTLTKTSSGKQQRSAAKSRYLAGELPAVFVSSAPRISAPAGGLARRLNQQGDLSEALASHLQAILGMPVPPGTGSSVSSLGLDSLAAVELQHEVEDVLGVVMSPSAALRAASIAELADIALTSPAIPSAENQVPCDAYELTEAQRALWFLDRALPGSAAYNITRVFRATKDVDPDRLSAALNVVVRRHPSLRLTVRAVDGEPRAFPGADAGIFLERVDARTWTASQESSWYRALATRPFNLEAGPLLRAAVLRREEDWLLALSLHHIVCDVASLTIIFADLAERYSGEDEPPAGVATVSPAALELLALDARREQLTAYWRGVLHGELPTLALPRVGTGQPGPAGSLAFEVNPELAGTLARYARGAGLTMHNLLLTAFQILLHRLTGQADLIVGVPSAGRRDRRLVRYVGYLVNVLPIRSSFQPGVACGDFALSTQRQMLDALDHQELPLSHMTRLVNAHRDHATAAVFEAMFACYTTTLPGGRAAAALVEGDPDAVLALGTGELRGYQVPDYTAQSDLCLNVVVADGGLRCQLQYDEERVTFDQANLVAQTFPTLLASIGEHPEAPAGRLPMLTADRAEDVLAAATGPTVPRPGHYLDSFERIADLHPDRIAVDDGVSVLTYAELDARANAIAARLRKAGVGTDVNVVVSAERSADYVAAVIGIHKADGCYVPVSPVEAPARAAEIMAAIAPAAVIVSGPRADLPGGPAPVLELRELAAAGGHGRWPRVGHGLAASTIIHTSGSTGVPKAAVSTTDGVTNHMWQMIECFGLGPSDCVAQTGPVSFDISVWQMLTPLLIGARVRIVPEPHSTSPARLLRAVLDGNVTMLELVPSNIVALLDAGLGAHPGALRVMLSTGEALTPEVVARWAAELPHVPLHNAYGPAECTDDVTAGLCAEGPGQPMTFAVGKPLANTSVYVLDEAMAPVPDGVVGIIHVGGGAVGRGYRGDPRRTSAAFVPDPFSSRPGMRLYRTGDLGRVTASGDLEFLGRADNQIKIRGQRVEAGEVEAALRMCPRVREAAVRIHQGPAGPALTGYLVMPDSNPAPESWRALGTVEDEQIRGALAELIPRYMIPTILVQVLRLARTANGKVDYKALAPAMSAGAERDNELFDDPLAASVRSIWRRLLQRETIAGSDSFFALGGHSLLALTMIDRVAETVGVQLDVDAVFRAPRLRDFITAVRHADPLGPVRERHPATPVPPGQPVRASAAQQRFWYLREIDPLRPTYNMPGVLRLAGELSEAVLEDALRDVLAWHSLLLARFSTDDDGVLYWTPGQVGEFELPRLDLRGAVAEFGDEILERIAREEANKVVDLRRELPFRALLVRLGAKESALFVVVDHIVCDGWSLSVFLTDLADCYSRRLDGRGPRTWTGHSFADFCRSEQSADQVDLAALWGNFPTGPVALSPAPLAVVGDPGAGRLTRWLSDALGAQVRTLAGETGTTPYLIFATALSVLTHGGSDDRETVLLGILIAQRDRPEWQRVVGPLLNVSVLATSMALTDTAGDALRLTREAALRAYRSNSVPFQRLVRTVGRGAGPQGSPFDVMLVMQPPAEAVTFEGLTTELSDIDTDAAPYPLTVDIEEHGACYQVSYRYATDRYATADMSKLATRFEAALQAIVADQSATVAAIREEADAGSV